MSLIIRLFVLSLSTLPYVAHADMKLKYMVVPQSSEDYFNCLDKQSTETCLAQQRKNYPTYSESNLKYKDKDILNFFNVEKKLELSVNTITLIPEKKTGILYGIGERYLERGDDDGEVNYYLLQFRPKAQVVKLGDYYSIDKNFILNYKGLGGNLVELKLY